MHHFPSKNLPNINGLASSVHHGTAIIGCSTDSYRWLWNLVLAAVVALACTPFVHADQPMTDQEFVQNSFNNIQMESEMSRVALEKSTNARTKKLARTIIKDNDAATVKLRSLAAPRRLDVPAQLDKEGQQQVAQLKSAAPKDLDALYRQQMAQAHGAAAQLFDKVAANPRADAEFRVFASQRLPQIKKQQQQLEKIAGEPATKTAKSTPRQG